MAAGAGVVAALVALVTVVTVVSGRTLSQPDIDSDQHISRYLHALQDMLSASPEPVMSEGQHNSDLMYADRPSASQRHVIQGYDVDRSAHTTPRLLRLGGSKQHKYVNIGDLFPARLQGQDPALFDKSNRVLGGDTDDSSSYKDLLNTAMGDFTALRNNRWQDSDDEKVKRQPPRGFHGVRGRRSADSRADKSV